MARPRSCSSSRRPWSPPKLKEIKRRLASDLHQVLGPDLSQLLRDGLDMPPDVDAQQCAAFQLGRNLLKKLQPDSSEKLDDRALTKFLQANSVAGAWAPQAVGSWMDTMFGELREECYRFWYRTHGAVCGDPLISSFEEVWREARHGPGAAVGAVGEDFYTKSFAGPLTCTDPILYSTYRAYANTLPRLAAGETHRAEKFGLGSIVQGSRIAFVPKNDTISRTICVEPVLNVMFQLGTAQILNKRLQARFNIDLRTQQFRNRLLASKGSVSNGFATLDLESASDSISAGLLWHLLPPSFLRWLEVSRCKQTETPRGVQTLGMWSSMGNGYTFSLQTMLFASMVVVVYRSLGITPIGGGEEQNFAVNGDDIVIVTAAAQRMLDLLRYCGFTPNPTKSFVQGPFRESCGGDYFLGHPVRSVYLKKVDSPQALNVAVNRLALFSARTGVFLPRLYRYLLSFTTGNSIPWWESDDAGVKTPSPGRGTARKNWVLRYDAWVPKAFGYTILGDGTVSIPSTTRRRESNPDGLLYSLLQGTVRDHFVSLRQREPKWKRKRRIAPNWSVRPREWDPVRGILVQPYQLAGDPLNEYSSLPEAAVQAALTSYHS